MAEQEKEIHSPEEAEERRLESFGETGEWFVKAFAALEKFIEKSGTATVRDEKETCFANANKQWGYLRDEYIRAHNAAVGADANEDSIDFANTLYPKIKKAQEQLNACRKRREVEHGNDPDVICGNFFELIKEHSEDVKTMVELAKLPLDSKENIQKVRENYDALFYNMQDYILDWKRRVHPILEKMKLSGERWPRNWSLLAKKHTQLRQAYEGNRKKGEERTTGIKQHVESILIPCEQEMFKKQWEDNFPDFEYKVAGLIILIQGARLLHGEPRKNEFIIVQGHLADLRKEWQELRIGGPYVSFEDRKKGTYSPVRRYDRQLNTLHLELTDFLGSASNAKPPKLDDAAYGWREALLGARFLWCEEKSYSERISFLHGFGVNGSSDAEIEAMIHTDEVGAFKELADGRVLERLRTRGEERARSREQIDKEKRRGLRHERLGMYRADERVLVDNAISAIYWKPEVNEKQRRDVLFSEKILTETESDLLVNNYAEFSKAQNIIHGIRTNIRADENLLLEQKMPEGAVDDVNKLEKVFDRYFRARRLEAHAWKKALNSSAWSYDKLKKRNNALKETYRYFLATGDRVFKQVPVPLRDVVRHWALSKLRLNATVEYVSWLLMENLPKVKQIHNLPDKFAEIRRLANDRKSNEREMGGEINDDELVLPPAEGGEQGAGEIEGIERGASPATLEESDEEGAAGHEDTLGRDGSEAVKCLIKS